MTSNAGAQRGLGTHLRVLLALACLGLPSLASAAEPSLLAGFKGGVNVSWITGQGWEEDFIEPFEATNRYLVGPTAGVFVSAVFPSLFALQAELFYAEHGGRVEGRTITEDVEISARATFLDVSLTAGRHFALGPGHLTAFLGPTLLLFQGTINSEIESESGALGDEVQPDREQLFVVTASIGYIVPLGPGLVVADIRYGRSLSSYSDDSDYFDNAVTLVAGYALPF